MRIGNEKQETRNGSAFERIRESKLHLHTCFVYRHFFLIIIVSVKVTFSSRLSIFTEKVKFNHVTAVMAVVK